MNYIRLLAAIALVLLGVARAGAEVLYRGIETVLPGADKLVSLNADETPLAAALSLLALQVGVDVVIAPGVDGEISVHLDNVPFAEAIAAVTAGRNVAVFTSGDVLVVATRAERTKAGMNSFAFRLRHLRPEGILDAVKALMSPDGEAVPLINQAASSAGAKGTGGGQEGAPPIVIFRDYPEHLASVEQTLSALDVPQHQVSIEVKFIETSSNDLKNLGVEWPTSMSGRVTGAPLLGTQTGTGSNTENQSEPYSYTNDLNSPDLRWGTVAVSDVNMLVNFLLTNEKAKIISDPRISVMDNEQATITVSTTTPVQTLNRLSEGAVIQDVVTYQYIEVGISLEVRPRVSDDGYVSLKVSPTVEEIVGYVGPTTNPAPVTAKRSVETTIKVKSGETAVLGGLMREKEIERTTKIPILGDIPLLGALFRNHRTEIEKTDLMILITPTVQPPG
jgi:type II secretory pathway component GspD/PulD (secretin)